MATGVPPKSGMKRGEVSVSLTYEGKKDVSTILSQSFNQYSLQIPINLSLIHISEPTRRS